MKTCKSPKCSYNVFSKGYCKYHWNIEYGKPIKKISDKQSEILKEFKPKRDKYMKENPICEAQLEGCLNASTDLHHIAAKDSRELWLDEENFMALCRHCHNFCKLQPKEAMRLGLIKSRI